MSAIPPFQGTVGLGQLSNGNQGKIKAVYQKNVDSSAQAVNTKLSKELDALKKENQIMIEKIKSLQAELDTTRKNLTLANEELNHLKQESKKGVDQVDVVLYINFLQERLLDIIKAEKHDLSTTNKEGQKKTDYWIEQLDNFKKMISEINGTLDNYSSFIDYT